LKVKDIFKFPFLGDFNDFNGLQVKSDRLLEGAFTARATLYMSSSTCFVTPNPAKTLVSREQLN